MGSAPHLNAITEFALSSRETYAGGPVVTSFARSALRRVQDHASGGNRVVFVHVPKCGGTSLREALKSAFTMGGVGCTTLDPVASKAGAEVLGEDVLDFREHWVLYEVTRRRHNLIMGHFPGSSALRAAAKDYTLVTLVREPTAQLLSEFYYNRDKTGSTHYKIDGDTTLKDYLRSPAARTIGSRYVSFYTDPALRTDPYDEKAVEAARATLAGFDVVGTLEDLDRFVARLADATGKRIDVGHKRESPTPQSARDADMDDEVRALLDEVCAPNRAIYEYARSLN